MSSASLDVAGLGWILADHLATVAAYPARDTKVEILNYQRDTGGPIARALIALARLGKKVALIGNVVDDDSGVFLLDALKRESVDMRTVKVGAGKITGFAYAFIEQDGGARTTAHFHGDIDISISELDKRVVLDSRVLLWDGRGGTPAIVLAELAHLNHVLVVLSMGSVRPNIEKMLSQTDVVIVSQTFVNDFSPGMDFETAGRALIALGPKVVVITLGQEGAWCFSPDGHFKQPAFVVRCVDTNGAGDVFAGGMVYGLLEGWNLRRCVQTASAVAAIKCTQLGNRGIPNWEELEQFLSEHIARNE